MGQARRSADAKRLAVDEFSAAVVGRERMSREPSATTGRDAKHRTHDLVAFIRLRQVDDPEDRKRLERQCAERSRSAQRSSIPSF